MIPLVITGLLLAAALVWWAIGPMHPPEPPDL